MAKKNGNQKCALALYLTICSAPRNLWGMLKSKIANRGDRKKPERDVRP